MTRPRVFKGPKVRAAVLENFRKCGRIDLSCEMAGVDRRQHYRWLAKYPDYREQYDQAMPQVADLLLGEMIRRGLEGVAEPVFSAGRRAVDFVVDANGKQIMEPCPCLKTEKSDKAKKCKYCDGSGTRPLMAPALIRRYDTQCLLAAGAARIPGFGKNARTVGTGTAKDEDDRDIEVTVVYKDKPLPTDEADDDE